MRVETQYGILTVWIPLVAITYIMEERKVHLLAQRNLLRPRSNFLYNVKNGVFCMCLKVDFVCICDYFIFIT
jgi:hypothetical protein